MPPEWDPHECSLVAWPARASMWGEQLAAAKSAHAATVRAIARFEPVVLVAAVGAGDEARRACATETPFPVEVLEEPLDDSWLRDNGPVIVRDASGRRGAVCFRFNAWGEKYQPYDQDARLAARLCDHLGLVRHDAPFVFEGGSVTVDGTGNVVTTEQCLLNPNRNPALTRSDIEGLLHAWLGAERVTWLATGLVEDRDTDGHVDNVCAFVAPGVALVQTTNDRANPNFGILRDNRARLDAAGIDTVAVPVLPYDTIGGRSVVVPPLNCYLLNGGVIVPVAECDPGGADAALAAFADALPGREVVGIPASVLAFGGGGVHCITQQVPR